MGTKVYCKSYLPGYFFMIDLNEDASTDRWSPFCEDKRSKNGEHSNCFMPMTFDGYSEYGKEVLKRMMLQHEAIFRKQVYELHRLYRIQRDLMNELQKKKLYSYSIPMETSPFNPFSFHMTAGDTRKIRQMPTMPATNSTYTRQSFYGTEGSQSPLHFLKESRVQSDLGLFQNGVTVNDCDLLESKVMNYKKRMFDLQLPADAYIDSEEVEGTGKGKIPGVSFRSVYCPNKSYGIESEGDVNLNLGTSHKPIHVEDDEKMDSHLWNSHNTRCLADLNEPIQGICSEETSASVSCVGPVAFNEDIRRKQLPMKQNLRILGLSNDSFQDNQKCLSNLIHSANEEHKWKWLSYKCSRNLVKKKKDLLPTNKYS